MTEEMIVGVSWELLVVVVVVTVMDVRHPLEYERTGHHFRVGIEDTNR